MSDALAEMLDGLDAIGHRFELERRNGTTLVRLPADALPPHCIHLALRAKSATITWRSFHRQFTRRNDTEGLSWTQLVPRVVSAIVNGQWTLDEYERNGRLVESRLMEGPETVVRTRRLGELLPLRKPPVFARSIRFENASSRD